jgi:hypothetical protein
MSDHLGREPTGIPFSADAMRTNLLRLQNEWETVQASHERNAIYQYLTAVFELVTWWAKEGKAVKRACRARPTDTDRLRNRADSASGYAVL